MSPLGNIGYSEFNTYSCVSFTSRMIVRTSDAHRRSESTDRERKLLSLSNTVASLFYANGHTRPTTGTPSVEIYWASSDPVSTPVNQIHCNRPTASNAVAVRAYTPDAVCPPPPQSHTLLLSRRDLFTPPRGVYTPCDMNTHPLGRTPRGHKVVSTSACVKFSHLILTKIIKFVATRCQILRLKCTCQIQFRLGLRPRHRWGSLQRSPDSLDGFKGAYF